MATFKFFGLGPVETAALSAAGILALAGGEPGAAAGTLLALFIPLASAVRSARSSSAPGRRGGPMEVARVPRVAAALAGLALCGSSMAAAFIHGSPGWKLAAAAACLCAVFASCSEWIRARRSIVGDAELRGWVERDREARAVEGRASDEARELEEAIGVAEEKPAPTAKKRRL